MRFREFVHLLGGHTDDLTSVHAILSDLVVDVGSSESWAILVTDQPDLTSRVDRPLNSVRWDAGMN